MLCPILSQSPIFGVNTSQPCITTYMFMSAVGLSTQLTVVCREASQECTATSPTQHCQKCPHSPIEQYRRVFSTTEHMHDQWESLADQTANYKILPVGENTEENTASMFQKRWCQICTSPHNSSGIHQESLSLRTVRWEEWGNGLWKYCSM